MVETENGRVFDAAKSARLRADNEACLAFWQEWRAKQGFGANDPRYGAFVDDIKRRAREAFDKDWARNG